MSITTVNMILRAYDQFCPLIIGAVDTPNLKINVKFNAALSNEFPADIHAAEVSFNRYVMACANDDQRLIGIPAYVLRGFRHRNYIAHRDSPLENLADLKGKRIGTNSWSDSGTMWARAALREAGVDIGDVQWVIGHVDQDIKMKPKTSFDVVPPEGSLFLSEEQTLMEELRLGKIDAVTTAFMPPSVYEIGSEFRRLVRDFRSAETLYHRRTGVYPAFHIIAFERSYAEQNPGVVLAVYDALQASWQDWWKKAKNFGEASPWQIAEIESMIKDFPEDTPPFGCHQDAHKKMLAVMCHEQYAQGIVQKPADPLKLFADFEAFLKAAGR
ncbi:ABC transporter substrate-binding protein [Paenochrobactrum glaciei]|uniref:4,5-dihydroxyphthalate decarboxylase n=1 Tax=Paenochrobactrum glaciei TaxID=486407 RepID=A0ABN1GKQ0_9HYPH